MSYSFIIFHKCEDRAEDGIITESRDVEMTPDVAWPALLLQSCDG